jgi:hypothetical protein
MESTSVLESTILERLTPPENLIHKNALGVPHVDFRNVRNCEELVIWLFAAKYGQTHNLQYFIGDCQKVVNKTFRKSIENFKHEGILQRMVLGRLRRHLKVLYSEVTSLLFEQETPWTGLRFWGALLDYAQTRDQEDERLLEGYSLTVYNPEFKVLKSEDQTWEVLDFNEDEPVWTLEKHDEEDVPLKLKNLPIQEKEDNRDTPERQASRQEIMSRMKDIQELSFEEIKELTSF